MKDLLEWMRENSDSIREAILKGSPIIEMMRRSYETPEEWADFHSRNFGKRSAAEARARVHVDTSRFDEAVRRRIDSMAEIGERMQRQAEVLITIDGVEILRPDSLTAGLRISHARNVSPPAPPERRIEAR